LAIGCQNLRKTLLTKLYTFGCSYTYGHGLPDCVNPSHATSSQMGYAKNIADGLNRELINSSVFGQSNGHINLSVLHHRKTMPIDSAVIIQWTHLGRKMMYWPDNPDPDQKWANPVTRPWMKNTHLLSSWRADKKVCFYHNRHEVWAEHFSVLDNELFEAIHLMNYSQLALNKIGVKKILHILPPEFLFNPTKDKCHSILPTWLDDDIVYTNFSPGVHRPVDFGADDLHPGVETNKIWTENILSEYGDYLR
jgi:hypothetical protein